jgi:hypothetical protein
MLTLNPIMGAVVTRLIASNSSNDAEGAGGSTRLFVHGGLINDLRPLMSGGFGNNIVDLGEERYNGEIIHL